MKKTLAIILLIIAFLIIYFLQANFFNWFTIAGVKPNFFIVFILFISLYAGVKVGIPFGVISGLFLDIILGKNLGTYGIMFGIIGIIGGYFDKNFSKESKITIILMVIGSTFIFEIGSYIIQIIEQSINVEIMDFIRILLIESMYNVRCLDVRAFRMKHQTERYDGGVPWQSCLRSATARWTCWSSRSTH